MSYESEWVWFFLCGGVRWATPTSVGLGCTSAVGPGLDRNQGTRVHMWVSGGSWLQGGGTVWSGSGLVALPAAVGTGWSACLHLRVKGTFSRVWGADSPSGGAGAWTWECRVHFYVSMLGK